MVKEDFNQTTERAKSMSTGAFISAILSERPDLKEKTVYTPPKGQSSHTVIIGDEVFKTARFDEKWTPEYFRYMVEGLQREYEIVKRLSNKGLPVSELVYEGKSFPFFSMTRVPGHPLEPKDVEKMTVKEKARLAKEIAAFNINVPRALPVNEAKKIGAGTPPLSDFSFESLQSALIDPVVQDCLGDHYNFLSKAVKIYIEKHQGKERESRKNFVHADLNPGNILYNPKTGKLHFIDFGFSRVTCPEEAFAGFYFSYSEDFVDMTLKEYSKLQPEQLTRKDMALWGCAYVAYKVTQAKNKPEEWAAISKDLARARKIISSSLDGSSSAQQKAVKNFLIELIP
jgi:aminoglycoside phosphotransferase (APT) family kinase protein